MRAPQEIPRAPDVACPSFQRAVRHLLANVALQAVLCGTLKGNKGSSILQRAPGEKETGRRLRSPAPRGSPHVGRVSGCGSLEGSQPRTPAMGELRRIVREHRPQKVRELLDLYGDVSFRVGHERLRGDVARPEYVSSIG
jgi:hypothetical protein